LQKNKTMKHLLLLIFCSLSLSYSLYAGGGCTGTEVPCATAEPFCTSNQYDFQNSTSTCPPDGPNYGCLTDQPNPVWYYMKVDVGGTFQIGLSQSSGPNGTGSGQDVDFALWGPFTSVASGCSSIMSGGPNPIQCSFSTAATETVGIGLPGGTGSGASTPPAAGVDQFYILLITNYSGNDGYISFNQTGGTGVADCSIVDPTLCNIDELTINIGACNPDNTYNVDGTFTYSGNPGTGTITVSVSNGANVFTQTFNPPFTDGVPVAYNINNIPADGAASTVTVSFSDDPACQALIDFNGVADCSCVAEIGSYTAAMTGVSQNNYVLCYGDQILITTNDDFTVPAEANNPPGPQYDPGVSWLIYSCPPSVGLTPSATEDVANDPCLLGVVSDYDFQDINDLFWIDNFPAGTFTNNTVYFVPITMYSIIEGIYSYVNTDVPCYDLGQAYAVQYLPEITQTQAQSCTDGSLTVTLNGGLPAVDGSSFTVVAGSLTPASAVFTNTSTTNGGTIVLTGLVSGQAYSFEIQDANGCPITISGTFTGATNGNFTYPQTSYCMNLPNPTPTITGVVGGTFSGTAGISLDPTTGIINLAASTPGTYVITYQTPSVACPGSGTFTVTINAVPLVTAGPDQTVCVGTNVTVNGGGALSYAWTGGIVNGVAFTAPIGVNSYTVTGTAPGGCTATDDVQITVVDNPVIDFTVNNTSGCYPVTVTFTNNTSNSANCTWDFGDGQNTVGCGSVSHTYENPGCFDVTLTVSNLTGCTSTLIQTDMICVYGYPVADFNPMPGVLSTLNPTTSMENTSLGAVAYAWNFGDATGIDSSFEPTHTYSGEEAGNYLITLIATNQYGCTDTAFATVLVNEEIIFYVPNTFTPDGDEFNQDFMPVFTSGFDPYNYKLSIYNRWGELLFVSHDPKVGWNGSFGAMTDRVPDGAYVWKIEYKVFVNDARKEVVGHVTVIR
jgi:gliding motility-associated-like protein